METFITLSKQDRLCTGVHPACRLRDPLPWSRQVWWSPGSRSCSQNVLPPSLPLSLWGMFPQQMAQENLCAKCSVLSKESTDPPLKPLLCIKEGKQTSGEKSLWVYGNLLFPQK